MEDNIKRSFFFNLGVILLLLLLLYIAFFATLHCVTHHGEEVVIPDVRGKDMYAAEEQLQAMHFEINVDSTYEPTKKPLTVLKQVPDTGSIVKEGRTVFLTVNMLVPPHIPMPNLVSLSFRSAEMMLRNNKLMLGDTTYKPDIAAGAILEQLYKGTPIKPGEMISQGSKISLIIGDGLGNTSFDVPDVTRLNVDEALAILSTYTLQPIITVYDEMSKITDTSNAIIVDQEPRALNDAGKTNHIKAGDIIDLKIMQHPDDQDIHNNKDNPGAVNRAVPTDKNTK